MPQCFPVIRLSTGLTTSKKTPVGKKEKEEKSSTHQP